MLTVYLSERLAGPRGVKSFVRKGHELYWTGDAFGTALSRVISRAADGLGYPAILADVQGLSCSMTQILVAVI